jgi:hypothetical protein
MTSDNGNHCAPQYVRDVGGSQRHLRSGYPSIHVNLVTLSALVTSSWSQYPRFQRQRIMVMVTVTVSEGAHQARVWSLAANLPEREFGSAKS